MPRLIVLETDSKEEDLFFNLVSRGRWDLPYYFSVKNYKWSEGIILFTMLCCSPSPTMKVGVAGNLIMTSDNCTEELEGWLKEWEIKFKKKEEKEFSTKEDTQKFHQELRKESCTKNERQEVGKRVEKRIKDYLKKVDKDLLAMCSH